MPKFELKYKLTLSTLAGSAAADHIQFNTKLRDPERDRDSDDNKVYTNENDPVFIFPSGKHVDVLTVASSTSAFMTYTLQIWIDNVEITKNDPPEPEYDGNGRGTIDKKITFK